MKGLLKYIFSSTYTKIVTVALIAIVAAIIPFVTKASGQPRDCNGNSIIWCGAYTKSEFDNKFLHGDGHHSPAVIQHDYAITGVSKSAFDSSATVNGYVTKSGEVFLSGSNTRVATGATSFGRYRMGCQGEHQVGDLWERPTTCSFKSSPLAAYVYMKDGVFQWAVLKACGNTIHAHPIAQHKFACVYLHANPTEGDRPLKVAFEAKASTQNVKVISYIFHFGNGEGQTEVKTDQLIARTSHTYQKEGKFTSFVIVHTDHGDTKETAPCEATINVTKTPPPPQFSCVFLHADKTEGVPPLTVNFDAKAAVKNAQVESFTFHFGKDEGTKTVKTHQLTAKAAHTYQKIGSFLAFVIVHTDKGDTKETADCEVPITVAKTPPPPMGCIKIIKEALDLSHHLMHRLPEFTFDLVGTDKKAFTNKDGFAHFMDLAPGVYKVSEEKQSLFTEIGASPSDPNDPMVGQVTVRAGKCVGVVFKNQQVLKGHPTPPTKELPNTGPESAGFGLLASAGLGMGIKGYIRSRKGLLSALLGQK